MGLFVCGGASLQCVLGNAPSVLMVLPKNQAVTTMPFANIMDSIPFVNILPFGMCNSPSNPAVIAATAAKLGVFSPSACIPATVAPWSPGCSTVTLGTAPALNDKSILNCMWGGVIQVKMAGQMTVMIP